MFSRYRFLEASSFLVDDAGFAELYYGVGNEFWAGDNGRPVSKPFAAFGGRFRLSTLFPVWNPVGGKLIEATAEYGNRAYRLDLRLRPDSRSTPGSSASCRPAWATSRRPGWP